MSLQHSESKRFSKKNPAVRTELAMAGQAVMIRAIVGDQGQELQMGATSDMDAASVATILDYHSPVRLTRMEKTGYTSAVLGQEEVAGQPCIVLEFTKGETVETYWFRMEDGLLIQQRRPALDGTMATESMDQYLVFGDNGLKLPATKSSTVAGQSMIVRTASATFNPEFAANAFELQP